jgi:hypothetical protein
MDDVGFHQWCRPVISAISKRKRKWFDIEAKDENKTKTFQFCSKVISAKPEHFNLIQKLIDRTEAKYLSMVKK